MKYKYYFKKPRSEIVKDILVWAAASSAILLAATSPYFGVNLIKSFAAKGRRYDKKKVCSVFWRLKRQGCIEIRKEKNQIYISLTEKGKKMANWLQIDALEIKKPRKWDARWRVVIFDIAQLKRLFREAFRGKLKQLGFHPLQKSVWVHAFDCRDEIALLKDFFGLGEEEVRLMLVEDIGDEHKLKELFNV